MSPLLYLDHPDHLRPVCFLSPQPDLHLEGKDLIFSARAHVCFRVQSVRLRQKVNVWQPERTLKLTKLCTRVICGGKYYDSTLSGCGRGQGAPQRPLTPGHVTKKTSSIFLKFAGLIVNFVYLYVGLGGLLKMFVLIQLRILKKGFSRVIEVKLSAHLNQGIKRYCSLWLSNK